jgi:hypothetical protein
MTRRGERITLLLIMALGALVRVSAMWKRVLLDDEVGIAGATGKTYGHILSEFGGKVTQPAQLLLARLARETLGEWIGVDAALRLPSLVFGVLAIALTARLARRIAGPEVAPFAALVVALHPFHVFYSQMATTYALASTLSLLSFLLFVDLVRAEARGARVRAGYVVATALAI